MVNLQVLFRDLVHRHASARLSASIGVAISIIGVIGKILRRALQIIYDRYLKVILLRSHQADHDGYQ